MNIKIAVADTYLSNKIQNKEFTYQELKDYLFEFKTITVSFIDKGGTPEENLEACFKSTKKKIWGFVGGQFEPEKRNDESLLFRSLIVLDVDEYQDDLEGFKQTLTKDLGRYKYLAYSTISHTPKKPRIRIVLFPNSDIPTEKYNQVSENFINTLSFKDSIDIASKTASQLMVISVTPDLKKLPASLKYTYERWEDENEHGELVDINEYITGKRKNDDTFLNSDSLEDEDILKYDNNTPLKLTDEAVIEYLTCYEIKSVDYHGWVEVGTILHHQYKGENKGKEIWKDWSNKYKKSKNNLDKIDAKWKGFSLNKDSPLTMLTIIKKYNDNKNSHPISIKELKDEIKKDQGNQKDRPLDLNKYRKRIHEIEKQLLQEDIGKDKKQFEALRNILSNINKYNDLLTINYEQDKPYTYSAFLNDIEKKPMGLKTGFISLDKHITIQPASLVFIAGRPSHGKTMTMLNLCGNMIEANPDKAFIFYSYEENKDDILLKIILSKTESNIALDGEEGSTLFDKAKNHLRNYALSVKTQKDGTNKALDNTLDKSCKKIEQWINEGRLQILDKKVKVEILSGAIIERVQVSEKPVAAIFIDYVQKLNTEEERVNRQQEIQRICQSLLNTALDERVNAAIILGAQVNREVKSLDTFTLDNMREAGDIEQDANLVLGIWDEQAGKLDSLYRKIETINNSIDELDFGIKTKGDLKSLKSSKERIGNEINTLSYTNSLNGKVLKIKVLKNRNGKKDLVEELTSYPNRFLIEDEDMFVDYVDDKINSLS